MKSNKLFTGFFFGVIFGLLAVFLFGTKQGKKVSKKLTKQGMDRVEDWKQVLTAELDDEITSEEKLPSKIKRKN
jgi:gas vesicle protein